MIILPTSLNLNDPLHFSQMTGAGNVYLGVCVVVAEVVDELDAEVVTVEAGLLLDDDALK